MRKILLTSFLVFLEGFISPMSADALLFKQNKSIDYKNIHIIIFSSVLGCVVGYLLGYYCNGYIGLLAHILDISDDMIEKTSFIIHKNASYAILFKSLTPIPNFIVTTIIGKNKSIGILKFTIMCFIGRSIKYTFVKFISGFFGEAGTFVTSSITAFFIIKILINLQFRLLNGLINFGF